MFAIPRLPAVIATLWPGLTRSVTFSRESSAATVPGIWLTGNSGPSNDCRTRKISGYCDMEGGGAVVGKSLLNYKLLTGQPAYRTIVIKQDFHTGQHEKSLFVIGHTYCLHRGCRFCSERFDPCY